MTPLYISYCMCSYNKTKLIFFVKVNPQQQNRHDARPYKTNLTAGSVPVASVSNTLNHAQYLVAGSSAVKKASLFEHIYMNTHQP